MCLDAGECQCSGHGLAVPSWVPGVELRVEQGCLLWGCTAVVGERCCSLCRSIDDALQVKITDNALSRDLFPMDYHCLGDNENRPVRWMALESLVNNEFSSASDVVRVLLMCFVDCFIFFQLLENHRIPEWLGLVGTLKPI